MQQVDANQPVGIAPEQAAADTDRRDPRDVGAVGEGGANDVELVLDAPCPTIKLRHIELTLEFASAEDGVALRIDGLLALVGGVAVAAGVEIVAAHHAGEPPENEVVETSVIDGGLETERAGGASQADLDGFCGLDGEVWIADVECAGGIVRAARE